MSFTVTLTTVALMLLYAVPGFLLVRKTRIAPSSIPAFAALLLYLCSPFQTLYAMQRIEYSADMVWRLALALGPGAALMLAMLGAVYFAFRRKQEQVPYRIFTAASALGNCGFMGLPLLEALMPDYPQGVAFASMFFMAMNILMWTVASFIITRDKRYISVRKIFFNPSTIAMFIALALFFGRVRLPGQLDDAVSLLSKMCTPLCMLILGMRLAVMPVRPIFTSALQYGAVALKLLVFPLFALAVCSLLPVEREFVLTVYILCLTPVGSLVQSFAEILGEGQDIAANVVLLSTFLSMFTIPLMLLIV